jgi:hypothetical protein
VVEVRLFILVFVEQERVCWLLVAKQPFYQEIA